MRDNYFALVIIFNIISFFRSARISCKPCKVCVHTNSFTRLCCFTFYFIFRLSKCLINVQYKSVCKNLVGKWIGVSRQQSKPLPSSFLRQKAMEPSRLPRPKPHVSSKVGAVLVVGRVVWSRVRASPRLGQIKTYWWTYYLTPVSR